MQTFGLKFLSLLTAIVWAVTACWLAAYLLDKVGPLVEHLPLVLKALGTLLGAAFFLVVFVGGLVVIQIPFIKKLSVYEPWECTNCDGGIIYLTGNTSGISCDYCAGTGVK